MAAERKLKGEIDRTLKKVQEGQELFEELWDQVHSCDNSNQREKLEGELKKEIKKLQRLREQIKAWITNADIKDKQPLVDARKSIEKDMERFKVCEREMKMAGRAGVPKAIDPKDRAKEDARDWINNCVESLTGKVEEIEYEIEELQGSVKKKQKPPPRLTELEEITGRHKDHISRLEKVLRCIDNETITPDELEQLRQDMDLYLGGDAEENGVDVTNVDSMYDELMDRLEAVDQAVPAAVAAHAHGKLGKGKDKDLEDKDREREKEAERQRQAAVAAKTQLIAQGNQNIKLNEEEDPANRKAAVAAAAGAVKVPGAALPAANQLLPAPSSPLPPNLTVAGLVTTVRTPASPASGDKLEAMLQTNGAAAATALAPPITPRGNIVAEPGTIAGGTTPASARAGAGAIAPGLPGLPPQVPQAAPGATPVARQSQAGQAQAGPPPASPAPAAAAGVWGDSVAGPAGGAAGRNNLAAKLQAGPQPIAGLTPATPQQPAAAVRPPPGIVTPGGLTRTSVVPPGYGPTAKEDSLGAAAELGDGRGPEPAGVDGLANQIKGLGLESGTDIAAATRQGPGVTPAVALEPPILPPVMPAYSSAAAKQILEACFMRTQPLPSDTDWRAYRPRHPTPTPPSYPRTPHEITEHPALFRKVDPECLFFAFYFQPDTYQQFLAAHELKRQSWRFHKHHNAWFQRFTEPIITNEEFEQGAYVYFDYNIVHDDMQTGWCYRRKENFTFRYDALEDELRTPQPTAQS